MIWVFTKRWPGSSSEIGGYCPLVSMIRGIPSYFSGDNVTSPGCTTGIKKERMKENKLATHRVKNGVEKSPLWHMTVYKKNVIFSPCPHTPQLTIISPFSPWSLIFLHVFSTEVLTALPTRCQYCFNAKYPRFWSLKDQCCLFLFYLFVIIILLCHLVLRLYRTSYLVFAFSWNSMFFVFLSSNMTPRV